MRPTEDILKEAAIIKMKLCDTCLGRKFAKWEKGENSERGRIIREALKRKKVHIDDCDLCHGIMGKINDYAEQAIWKLNDWEYEYFLVGSRVDEMILQMEREMNFQESIKHDINRSVGKIIEKTTKKKYSLEPDIVIIVDTRYDNIQLDIKPLYIYGRYLKKKRGMPQTRWICMKCLGRGCEICRGTGKKYMESVEEYIGEAANRQVECDDYRLHGMGREDVDARMLGNGRPFVLEMTLPKRRKIDLKKLAEDVKKDSNDSINVILLRFGKRKDIEYVKKSAFPKIYRVVFEVKDNYIEHEKIKKLESIFNDVEIRQRTPRRVLHRRSDLWRIKKVHWLKIISVRDNTIEVEVKASSGTYIKELVHGDEGRTLLSIQEMLGVPCIVRELDVIKICNGEDEYGKSI